MESLNLSIELSNLALETGFQTFSQDEMLSLIHDVLDGHVSKLGLMIGSTERQKSLGGDLVLMEYQFDYEQHSVQVQLATLMPRGDWKLQG